MDTSNKGGDTNNKGFKVAIIFSITLLLVVIITIVLIYNTNEHFQKNINDLLSNMPGFVGDHYKNLPTEMERNEKINYLSSYFLDIESSISADKIYIIKKDDENLYIDLVRAMNSISMSKTEDIVLAIRNMELRKDLLFSLYEDVQEDEKQQFLSQVSRISSQDLQISLLEIESKYTNKEFLEIIGELNNEKIGEILYYTDPEIRNYILKTFQSNKRILVNDILLKIDNELNTLIDMARLYETKPIDTSLNAIGSTGNYSIDKLAIIYSNLSVLKSAELLSNIEDEKFLEDLFSSIIRSEQLYKTTTNITKDISKAMEFLNEYNSKIKDLVIIYEKMTPSKVAEIVSRMIDNTDNITSIELTSEEVYQLSDKIIIIDVLLKMKNQTLSKVLDFMESDKASQITRLLAEPKNGE